MKVSEEFSSLLRLSRSLIKDQSLFSAGCIFSNYVSLISPYLDKLDSDLGLVGNKISITITSIAKQAKQEEVKDLTLAAGEKIKESLFASSGKTTWELVTSIMSSKKISRRDLSLKLNLSYDSVKRLLLPVNAVKFENIFISKLDKIIKALGFQLVIETVQNKVTERHAIPDIATLSISQLRKHSLSWGKDLRVRVTEITGIPLKENVSFPMLGSILKDPSNTFKVYLGTCLECRYWVCTRVSKAENKKFSKKKLEGFCLRDHSIRSSHTKPGWSFGYETCFQGEEKDV